MNIVKMWILDVIIRAVKTFAQTALSLLTVGQAFIEINWLNVISISGVACVVSFLTSIADMPNFAKK